MSFAAISAVAGRFAVEGRLVSLEPQPGGHINDSWVGVWEGVLPEPRDDSGQSLESTTLALTLSSSEPSDTEMASEYSYSGSLSAAPPLHDDPPPVYQREEPRRVAERTSCWRSWIERATRPMEGTG